MRVIVSVILVVGAALLWAFQWGPAREWWAGPLSRDGSRGLKPVPARRNLASMSKAELYAEAKRLGVPGRSEMSKEQLIRAIGARIRE